jgi:hypothetical protein
MVKGTVTEKKEQFGRGKGKRGGGQKRTCKVLSKHRKGHGKPVNGHPEIWKGENTYMGN